MHALDRRRGAARDFGAGAGRTGKGHHVHFTMRGQRRADAGAVAIDEIEHARGNPRLVHHLRPQNGAEGRVFGGLEHHGAAGGEGGHHFRGDLIHRPIPRRDQRANADRLLHQAHVAAHFFELEGLQHLDHGADVADPDAGLRSLRERDGRAHFRGDGLGDFIVMRLVGGENALHQREALGRRGTGIAVEGTAGGADRPIHILGAAHGDHTGDRLGGGVDHLEFLRFGRIDPRAVDVELPIVVRHCNAP